MVKITYLYRLTTTLLSYNLLFQKIMELPCTKIKIYFRISSIFGSIPINILSPGIRASESKKNDTHLFGFQTGCYDRVGEILVELQRMIFTTCT